MHADDNVFKFYTLIIQNVFIITIPKISSKITAIKICNKKMRIASKEFSDDLNIVFASAKIIDFFRSCKIKQLLSKYLFKQFFYRYSRSFLAIFNDYSMIIRNWKT